MKNIFKKRIQSKANEKDSTRMLLERLETYSMGDLDRTLKLYTIAMDVVSRNIPGDFVECGVWNGGSAATIALALRNSDRKTWLYDSFQGMPPTSELDGIEAAKAVGSCRGSEEKVLEAMWYSGYKSDEYTIRKGLFKNTFQEPIPEKVAILHIDADWYENVILSLNTFYDNITDGGVILLDDFGHWEGCREAYYDFVQQRGIKPLVERFGHSLLFWIKGRKDNRVFIGKREIP
jgi:O-methyltransferase